MSKPLDAGQSAPAAARRAKRLTAHGETRTDPYYWLRERDNPEVLRLLEAENAYTEAVLERWTPLRQTLKAEMAARIVPNYSSVPYRDGDYFYYYRYEPSQEYPIYCRKRGALDAAEERLLDGNALATGHDYFSLRGFSVAPNHAIAVFAVDTEGRRFYTLCFVDLACGEVLDERIENVTSSSEWSSDSSSLYYVRQHPDSLRDYQVLRHTMGAKRDALVYQEDDAAYWLDLEKSLSGESIFLVSAATDTTEVRVIAAADTGAEPQVFLPRRVGHEYYVTDGVDRYFVLSNDAAKNFRVFETPLQDTARPAWQEVVPERESVLIEGFDAFASHLVLSAVEQGLDQLEVVERSSFRRRRIEIPQAVYSAYTHDNFRYDAGRVRFTYESLTQPETTCEYGFADRAIELVRQEQVGGGFESAHYRTERLSVTARDGTEVPVSLAYRKDLGETPVAPLLLYAYGAYGISSEPSFDSDVVSLLDRGFIYAIAHVRGGSELGRQWYYDGRQQSKENSFHDFIDVTAFLIDAGYTAPDRCFAMGASAGGLLIGAVVNDAPQLYRGMIAGVPFVDVLTTMLDASIPLTTGEYDEWGDPETPDAYRTMRRYSPYDNVAAIRYPALLVTAGLHDSQVQYWEPAKWVAKLRYTSRGGGPVLLKTDLSAGHGGKTGRYRQLEDTALEFTFLLALEALRNGPP